MGHTAGRRLWLGRKEGSGWSRAFTKESQSLRSRRRVWARSLYPVPLRFPDLRAPKAGLQLLDVNMVFWSESPKSTCSFGLSRGRLAAARGWGLSLRGFRAAAWDTLERGMLTRQVQG